MKDNNAKMYSRRHVLDMMASGGLAALMSSIPLDLSASSEPEVVRVGYLPITDATPLLVAHALGFFEEEGLNVAKPQLIKRWSTLVRGFAGGHFNLVHLLNPIPIWMRYNNNFPVKILAWAHINGSAIVVGKDSGINRFQDCGGKLMAIPHWYSMHNIILQRGLRDAGIKPIIDTGSPIPPDSCALKVVPPPVMVKAMNTQKIAGYIVAEPFNAMGELSTRGKILRFTGDMWRNHPCCVICTHEKMTLEKPAWTQKIVNAVVRAQLYAANHKKEVAHMLSKDGKGYLPTSAKVLERAMTHYDPNAYASPNAIQHQKEWGNGRIDFCPYPYPSATRLFVEMMNETLVDADKTFLAKITPDFAAQDSVNYTFVKHALERYPEWKKLPGVNAQDPFERNEVIAI